METDDTAARFEMKKTACGVFGKRRISRIKPKIFMTLDPLLPAGAAGTTFALDHSRCYGATPVKEPQVIHLWKQYYWEAIGRGSEPQKAGEIANRRLIVKNEERPAKPHPGRKSSPLVA